MKRTYKATFPDGGSATRTTKTKNYTHAMITKEIPGKWNYEARKFVPSGDPAKWGVVGFSESAANAMKSFSRQLKWPGVVESMVVTVEEVIK